MLEDLELLIYEKYIKGLVVDGKIYEGDLDKLDLSPQEKKFVLYIINKKKIIVTEEKIRHSDRSPYVRDNNYGDIQSNNLGKIDEPVMSKIEYSDAPEKVFENYEELDEYLEKRFIPTYVLMKRRKNIDGEIEYYPSIRLYHIMALKLSEDELEHVMEYLNQHNIRVGGKGATLDGEFENYDYVTTYKESKLPLNLPPEETLKKISLYKQNKSESLRAEIIEDNMRLVPYIAYRYTMVTGINQHELESYGYEGLILALDKFDLNYNCPFHVYAIAYIRALILRGIQEISVNKRSKFYSDYINAKLAIENENNTTIAEKPELIDDIIDLLVATDKIGSGEKYRQYAKSRIISMEFDNESLEDTLEELYDSDYFVNPHDYEEEVLNSVSNEEVRKLLKILPPREGEIIRLRYGFYDGISKTVEEISEKYGIPVDIIKSLEAKALRKLRQPKYAKKLIDYLNQETENFGR